MPGFLFEWTADCRSCAVNADARHDV